MNTDNPLGQGRAIVIAPLQDADRAEWLPLAQGYKAFYKTSTSEAEYQQA